MPVICFQENNFIDKGSDEVDLFWRRGPTCFSSSKRPSLLSGFRSWWRISIIRCRAVYIFIVKILAHFCLQLGTFTSRDTIMEDDTVISANNDMGRNLDETIYFDHELLQVSSYIFILDLIHWDLLLFVDSIASTAIYLDNAVVLLDVTIKPISQSFI